VGKNDDAMSATRYAALLRGINVGKAKRIAMADLRASMEGLGYTDVRTLLNSGNVVFSAPRKDTAAIAAAIEKAIVTRFGFSAAVVVVTVDALESIVAADPLSKVAANPSKYLVAFVVDSATLAGARPLTAQAWAPEALALGNDAAYLWCAGGINDSKLALAFNRATRDAATMRNWATVLKLLAAARAQEKER
jgi:uncharacterized protein (DUF1697 family)